MTIHPLHGVMAEFTAPNAVLDAARSARQAGYTAVEAYTPYPVEGLAAALGNPRNRVPFIVFVGGLVGAAAGFFMMYWTMAVDYPLNVGGRPFNSWPVWIPVTFEMMILFASLAAFFGTLFLNGLPRLHHPVFDVPGFERATQDRFFLCIESTDPRFDVDAIKQLFAGMAPVSVVEVPNRRPRHEPGGGTNRPTTPRFIEGEPLLASREERP
jgi:hypothetical protein